MNPFHNYEYVAKKYAFELLQEKYEQNENIIVRLAHYLATDEDARDFIKLMVDAYEKGYLRAVDDHREKLKELGYNVQITASQKTVEDQKDRQ